MSKREKRAIRITALRSTALVVAMFAFAMWVMPPLYTLFCEVAGINGKTGGQYTPVSADVDTSRTVEVRFVATKNDNMPWAFKPRDYSLQVHPGESVVTHFFAANPTSQIMVGQAVPSMVPHNATDYFHKTECFCFNQQTLGPGEEAELGLQFIVDQEMPKGVTSIILSYTLFDVTASAPEAVKHKAEELTKHNNQELEKTDSPTLTAR